MKSRTLAITCLAFGFAGGVVLFSLYGFRAQVVSKPASNARLAPPGVNAGYVILVSLNARQDSIHSIPIEDGSGTTWYRSESEGFSLSCGDPHRVYATESLAGGYSIVIGIAPNCETKVASWTRERLGEMAGIVVDGELVYVARLTDELRSQISILGIDTWEEAQTEVKRILEKGFLISAEK